MRKTSAVLVPLALLSTCVILTAGVGDGGRLKVAVSIFPLSEFVRAVGGERVEVSLFLPPGAEIHTWQPSARQVLRLGQAALFIYVGAHLEPWAQDIVRSQAKPGLKVLEACRGVVLLRSDPHIWLDFDKAISLVERIRASLAELDPRSAEVFQKNADSYSEKLRRLDERYRAFLGPCKQRTLVLGGHAAFGYLAARYGLEQVSLYGLSPDSEPTPSHLLEVARLVKAKKIPAVFFEAAVNPKLARLLARETGAEALPLNDGASISPSQFAAGLTFLDIMDDNLRSLEHGLRCR
jgi:zinc transport system substrate-binding protein